jgi:hypothetical protein
MTGEILRSETADRLRRALVEESYDEAQAALAEYQRHIDAALAAHPAGAPPPSELAQEAAELMQWALRVAHVARARARDELEQVSTVLRYLSPAPQVRSWKVDG